MAADLSQDPDLSVETVKGGLGELSVGIDGSKVFEGSRLWYSKLNATETSAIDETMDRSSQS